MLVVDVRESVSAERAVQALLARFGRLDILVANASAIFPFDHPEVLYGGTRLR